jgi:hypothetical protein
VKSIKEEDEEEEEEEEEEDEEEEVVWCKICGCFNRLGQSQKEAQLVPRCGHW